MPDPPPPEESLAVPGERLAEKLWDWDEIAAVNWHGYPRTTSPWSVLTEVGKDRYRVIAADLLTVVPTAPPTAVVEPWGTCENPRHDSKPQEWHPRNEDCIDWHPGADRPAAVVEPDLDADAVEAAAKAVTANPPGWSFGGVQVNHPLSRHGGGVVGHRYDGTCAVCRASDQAEALEAVLSAAITTYLSAASPKPAVSPDLDAIREAHADLAFAAWSVPGEKWHDHVAALLSALDEERRAHEQTEEARANLAAALVKAEAALDEVTAQRDRNDEQTTIQLNATEHYRYVDENKFRTGPGQVGALRDIARETLATPPSTTGAAQNEGATTMSAAQRDRDTYPGFRYCRDCDDLVRIDSHHAHRPSTTGGGE